MMKKILSIVILVALLATSICAFAENEAAAPAADAQPATEATEEAAGEKEEKAAPAVPAYVPIKQLMEQSGMTADDKGKEHPVNIVSASFDAKTGIVTFVLANNASKDYKAAYILECDETGVFQVMDMQQYSSTGNTATTENRMCSSISQLTLGAGEKATIQEKAIIKGKKTPKFNIFVQYSPVEANVSHFETIKSGMGDGYVYCEDITNPKSLKGAAGNGMAGLGKVADYLLDNIIAIIALILSCVLLFMTFKKNSATSEAVVENDEVVEVAEEEVAVADEIASETEDASEEASSEDAE